MWRMIVVGALMLTAGGQPARAGSSPYASEQARSIKALSASEREGLLRGDGMSTALAAELNHYPGPRHVLQLAGRMGLTADQIATVRRLEAEMTQGAQSLGRALIANEATLDRLFDDGKADAASLGPLVARSAELQGQLRLTHLSYHLRMRELLSPQQVALYDQLRGYDDVAPSGSAHGHRHGG